jgi:hypothetical protein
MTENEKKQKPVKKRNPLPVFLFILFLIFIGIPLVCIGLSFIGRISPDSVIPNSFTAYVHVPDPVRFSERLLAHESLPEIAADPGLPFLPPLISRIRESRLLENKLIHFTARGSLDGAALSGKRILAAWDAGILAPFLRFLPFIAGRLTIPNLYYVQAGKNSRFEYRLENGGVYYAGPYRNLLIVSDDSDLFESVLDGSSRDGDIRGSAYKTFNIRDFDIAFLVSQEMIRETLAGQEPKVAAVMDQLQLPSLVEAAVRIYPNKLDIQLVSPLSSTNKALSRIIERDSGMSAFIQLLPDSTQYSTVVSAAALEELFDTAVSIYGPELGAALQKADASSRTLLRLSMEDILFSWTGGEFAVFGMEGRPSPVYAVQIRDEKKRQEVFDKAFKSLFLNENTRFVLDGNRIPQILLPEFLDAVLKIMAIKVPSPYYIVENDYLFISESAENLLAAINAVRKNAILPRTGAWKTLTQSGPDKSAFSLFYSLDRTLPFFLRGNTGFNAVLRLYRQGLVRLAFEDRTATIFLSAIPGSGKGVIPAPGYPFDLGGKAGSAVFAVSSGRRESRILLTRDNAALAVNPADRTVYELQNPRPVQVIPAAGIAFKTINDAAAWVVNSQGQVTLVNGNMEPVKGFPRVTGARLSAYPAAHGGKLFLADDDGLVYTVDAGAAVSQWGIIYDAALRSPPSFLDVGNKTYAGFYPKSIINHEIWLTDLNGGACPGWPIPISGIAFGSPLLFTGEASGGNAGLFAAFITMAGELTVVDENAAALPAFPVELPGVFYLQPVYDGEFLWSVSSDGTLYQISLDGTVLRQKIPNLSVKEEGYLTAVDVNGDKIPEIFFTGEGNALYGYARNFNSLDGFPLPVWGRPVFADLNGDGKLECTGVGLDNKLYQWQFK